MTLFPANPDQIIEPAGWEYWKNRTPFADGLVRGFVDDPDDPIDPEDMPIDTSLPAPGQPEFNDPAEEVDAVTLNIATPSEPPPSGFTLTGYWIRGIGQGQHSEVVGPNDVNDVLRENNGTGNPYTPTQLNGQWFCIRAIYNNSVLSGDLLGTEAAMCNTFQQPVDIEPPPDPTGVTLEVASPNSGRLSIANLHNALGFEVDVFVNGAYTTTLGMDPQHLTAGGLPMLISRAMAQAPSQSTVQLRVGIRSYNDDGT